MSPERRSADDESLAAALQAGEAGAAESAWRRFCPTVQNILRRQFQFEADAPDLCQEVFLRFFSRIGELRERRALRGFLLGICLGVAQNERRRASARRRIMLTLNGDLPEQPIAPFDPEARQALDRLSRVLGTFGDDEGRLFTARHLHKLELAEIAASHGWSVPQTKRRTAIVTRRIGQKVRNDPALEDYAAGFNR
ncbi:MAG TPA: sigma-70 family RNA polymerase sigma factor [Polyangia bacterium]|nr:sigma-70 family RNA polymerase sigma factor [Polyangia bacterium]